MQEEKSRYTGAITATNTAGIMFSKTHEVLSLLLLLCVLHLVVHTRGAELRGPCGSTLPSFWEMMETAFPTW